MAGTTNGGGGTRGGERPYFSDDLLFRAASLYYQQDATQAEVAKRLQLSRASVSRMLAEARARGLVRIEVRRPKAWDTEAIAERIRTALGLKQAWIAPDAQAEPPGSALAQQMRSALTEVQVEAGDGVLVSPGRTIWEVSHHPLPPLPGVIVAPTGGGMLEPEAFYQTNEITRLFAASTGGEPWFLYAPALPGKEVHELLLKEPTIHRVISLWQRARVALLGIGAPLHGRQSFPSVLPKHLADMSRSVGDICLRPYTIDGEEIPYPGSDHLVSMELACLHRLEWAIALATGVNKSRSIIGAARGGHINALITDADTAVAVLDELGATG